MMSSSRDEILGKLQQAKRPFPHTHPPKIYQRTDPLPENSAALQVRFVQEAELVDCVLHHAQTEAEAITAVLNLIGHDTAVSCWNPAHIPLPGLAQALDQHKISRVGQDATVRVGITGVDAALAATGSLVMLSGNGRYRAASLLPETHIAILTANQILPDLESYFAAQEEDAYQKVKQASNLVIVSGPSRTADIAMQLVLGMHGPGELHIILLESPLA
ncbi:MAG: hypothetical protein GY805_00405 [Chloroflexi bacterium]|nr:hypothetical protein [Chloroflexota bacterium]